jgi:kynureninase
MTDADLIARRDEFPILATSVYLVSNSLGAMPRATFDALHEYAGLWAAEGVVAWNRWLPMVREVGDMLAGIMAAAPGSVMMGQNVTNLVAQVASCFDWTARRNRVVLTDVEFPTVRYFWDSQRALGAEVVEVVSDDGLTIPLDRLLAAIDERTALVCVSHVVFRSAALLDVAAVIRRAHEVGALVLLDSYQATGAVPFDVSELDVDMVVGGSVKWLCGGPGAGYLYVRPDLVGRLRPRVAGWFSHERPFGFEPPPIEYAHDIGRFMGGTPAVPSLYTAREGYRYAQEIGVRRIREKSERQTQRIVEQALAEGLTVNSPLRAAERGGHVTVDFPGSEAVSKELIARRFIIDYRPGAGIRIAPHWYTTDQECEAIMQEIATIRAGSAVGD